MKLNNNIFILICLFSLCNYCFSRYHHHLKGKEKAHTVPSSCRLCAGGCGGQFTADGGAVSMDQKWPKFFKTFDKTCGGELKNNEYNMHEGVHLCCQAESSTVSGGCRFCTSCGGSYSNQAGAFMCDQNWPNWVSTFGCKCNGESKGRSHKGSGMLMCCKSDDCALCSSCGGSYPEANGLMSTDQKWPNFFSIKGEGCSGEFTHNQYKEGVTLCCKSKGI